jgi:disulfide bond formation protein DsbB
MIDIFNTLTAAGSLVILLFLVLLIVSWLTDNPIAAWTAKNATIILRVIFAGAVIGSLIYSNYFGYTPCLLCWYERICIYPVAILLFTDSLRKSALLQRQVVLLSSAGFLIALYHNFITVFPNVGDTVCDTVGVSCQTRYVYQFGFVSIPLMSAIVLLSGIIISALALRNSKGYPHKNIAN